MVGSSVACGVFLTPGGEKRAAALAPKVQKAKSHRSGPYRLTLSGPSWGMRDHSSDPLLSILLVRALDSTPWWRRAEEQDREMVGAQTDSGLHSSGRTVGSTAAASHLEEAAALHWKGLELPSQQGLWLLWLQAAPSHTIPRLLLNARLAAN